MKRHISLQTPHGTLHGQLARPEFPRSLLMQPTLHHATLESPLAVHCVAAGHAFLAMELLGESEIHFTDAAQNVPRLTQRLLIALDLIRSDGDMQDLPLGIAATGDIVPAAIRAAAQRDAQVRALACHSGLADRAGVQALELLAGPLLMLFDADDATGQTAFRRVEPHLFCPHERLTRASGHDASADIVSWFSRIFAA